jgi:serine/threonine-protein kinase
VGSVLGTAAYLAPEQARGEEAGPRSDLYALGVVTYQLISGRLPYEASSLTELALKQQQEAPPMLDTLVAAVRPELADAVAIALALDPADRYQTAREMGRALTDGEHGIASSQRRPGARASETAATSLLAGAPAPGRSPAADGATAPASAVKPRRPRPGPARAAAPAPAASGPPVEGRATRRRSRGRLLFALLALLAVAAAIAAVALVTAPSTTKVFLRNVVYTDVQQTSSALKQLVSENTK